MKTLYEVLQVTQAADTEIIKAAYNSLIQRFYPDGSSRDPNDDFLKALNQAYEVLSDPKKRAGYDAALANIGAEPTVNYVAAFKEPPETVLGPEPEVRISDEPHFFEYAGFWQRCAAVILDGFVLAIPIWILAGFTIALSNNSSTDATFGLIYLISFGTSALYFTFMESGEKCASYGKRWLGLKVLDSYGHRLSSGRAFARWISHLFSYVTLYIGFFIQPFTTRKQALHDLISGTIVVQSEHENKSSGIFIAVVVFMVIIGTGILTAIAIPAYHDYARRAKSISQSSSAISNSRPASDSTDPSNLHSAEAKNVSNDDESIREILHATAEEVNRSAPYTIDKNTRLDSSTAGPGRKFTYNYTLVTLDRSSLDENLLEKFAGDVKNRFCTDPAMKDFYQNRIVVDYHYRDRNGKFIKNIEIEPSECGY